MGNRRHCGIPRPGCSPCRTYMSDMRLHVAAANSYFYPDVLVTCSALDLASPLVKTEPKLIIEVLSPSTAAYGRGLKFSHYRSLTCLEEFALIDLDTRSTDCYRKGADGLWVLHPFARGEAVSLASVALTLSAEQLFAEVPESCWRCWACGNTRPASTNSSPEVRAEFTPHFSMFGQSRP